MDECRPKSWGVIQAVKKYVQQYFARKVSECHLSRREGTLASGVQTEQMNLFYGFRLWRQSVGGTIYVASIGQCMCVYWELCSKNCHLR